MNRSPGKPNDALCEVVPHAGPPLPEQQPKAAKLDAAIAANLKELGYGKD